MQGFDSQAVKTRGLEESLLAINAKKPLTIKQSPIPLREARIDRQLTPAAKIKTPSNLTHPLPNPMPDPIPEDIPPRIAPPSFQDRHKPEIKQIIKLLPGPEKEGRTN
jgi:hypothetical protein